MISYDFKEWQFSEFTRRNGHMIVRVSVLSDETSSSSVRLIFDTGAYLTVISRPTARKIKLPLGKGKHLRVRGFLGEQGYVDGELVEISRIMLGKHFIHDVKILVPLTDVAITEVLGENILEYLNYVVDHDKDVIYFKKNPNPKRYINKENGIDLSCGRVLLSEAV